MSARMGVERLYGASHPNGQIFLICNQSIRNRNFNPVLNIDNTAGTNENPTKQDKTHNCRSIFFLFL